jgi:hydrogenase 3 maturation protease
MKRMLLGVGNRLSRDDGAGPTVARELEGSDWIVVDCGTSIENVSGWVLRERPDVLVVVDAAMMGATPGTIRRLSIGSHDRMLASTHGLPLSFVLERMRAASGRTVLIGIQPEDLSLGEGLSPRVADAVQALAAMLQDSGDLDTIPLQMGDAD